MSDNDVALTTTGSVISVNTGGVLDESSSDADLATGLAYLRWMQDRIKVETQRIGAIMLGRMDADASWTRRAGGYTLTAPSPAAGKTEWNAADLRRVTTRLVANGTLTQEAAERCFRQPPEEVAAAGVKAILATLDKADQDSVRSCNVPKPTGTRTVKVT